MSNPASQGDSDLLIKLLYDELKQLAKGRIAAEQHGLSLGATGLVHEAYLRLKQSTPAPQWNCRGHFFAAAAEAMRRILVERARARLRLKRGGGQKVDAFDEQKFAAEEERSEEVIAIHEALSDLQTHDPSTAELVKLRYFAGLTHQQAAIELGITRRQADKLWILAKAWLGRRLKESESQD